MADALYFHRLVSALGPNADGLTDAEVAEIETRYGFTYPPELRALLQYCVPISPGPWAFPNWRVDSENLRDQLNAPLEGLLFDVQNNWWHAAWGTRPEGVDEALVVASACIALQPKLIPVYGHRFMPSTNQPGAPVLSVSRADVIYYGFSLQGYFRNEFHLPVQDDLGDTRHVPFWSDLVYENCGPPPYDWWNQPNQ